MIEKLYSFEELHIILDNTLEIEEYDGVAFILIENLKINDIE